MGRKIHQEMSKVIQMTTIPLPTEIVRCERKRGTVTSYAYPNRQP